MSNRYSQNVPLEECALSSEFDPIEFNLTHLIPNALRHFWPTASLPTVTVVRVWTDASDATPQLLDVCLSDFL